MEKPCGSGKHERSLELRRAVKGPELVWVGHVGTGTAAHVEKKGSWSAGPVWMGRSPEDSLGVKLDTVARGMKQNRGREKGQAGCPSQFVVV